MSGTNYRDSDLSEEVLGREEMPSSEQKSEKRGLGQKSERSTWFLLLHIAEGPRL